MLYKKFILFLFITIILIMLFIVILQLYCKKENKTFHEILYPDDYNVFFNEQKYRKYNKKENYEKILLNGFNVMKTKKLVIGSLFKDSAYIFSKFRQRMENLTKYFNDVQFVIFENDSKDNSRVLLLNWEMEDKNVHIIKCKENNFCILKNVSAISYGTFSSNRMKKMTEYRNYVKKYVDENFSNYDYFMMIDSDTRGPFSIEGLAYSFGKNLDWDMMSAYGLNGIVLTGGQLIYYDYLAYLKNFNTLSELKNAIYINNLNNYDDFIPINNAFGGLSIYKMSSIKNVDYTPKDGNYICEHTIFTNNMKDKGFNKFFINPKLIFLVGKQGSDTLSMMY